MSHVLEDLAPELLAEYRLAKQELLLEKKQVILYGVGLPLDELDPDLLDLSVVTLGELLGYEADPLARDVVRWQNDTIRAGGDADLVLGYRGGGKTTWSTVVRAIWYAVRDRNVRILITSETQTASKGMLREIQGHLENNADLIAMFGIFVPLTRDRRRVWEATAATIRQRTRLSMKEPTFLAMGVGGQAASFHFDVIFGDDLVTFRSARTKQLRAMLSDWQGSTLEGLKMPHSRTHFAGTRYFPGDLWEELEKGRREDGGRGPLAGAVLKIPAEVVVVRADGTKERRATSHRFPLAVLDRKRELMGRVHYAAQMLQDTELMKGEVFNLADFNFYDPDDPTLAELRRGWAIWQYFDLAAKKTETGDYFAGVTIAVSPDKLRVDVLDLIHFRGGISRQRRAIQNAVAIWRPVLAGVEAVAMQAGFAEELQEGGLNQIEPQKVETDKVLRAMRITPTVETGKVWLPLPGTALGDKMTVLLDELAVFPSPGSHDDTVDAFVGAITLAIYGGVTAAGFGDDDEEVSGRAPAAPAGSRRPGPTRKRISIAGRRGGKLRARY